jgi:type IV secretory pathway VirB3-like protein
MIQVNYLWWNFFFTFDQYVKAIETFKQVHSLFKYRIFLTIIWKQGMCMYMNQIKFHLEEQIHQIKDNKNKNKIHIKSSKCPNLRNVLYAKEKAYY